MCLGEGVKPFFSYLFFFTCIRGTGRDLMGRLFCPIGVQRCMASRFSTTSQARLISYQILLLNYFPPSNGHPRPFSQSNAVGKHTAYTLQWHFERRPDSREFSRDRPRFRALLP